MQLPQKQKTFSVFFSKALKFILNFEHFQKQLTLIGNAFKKVTNPENVVR